MRGDATQRVLKVGKFDEQVWGDSDERHHADERAFWFLGPATYRGHVGERPMAITWELHHDLPGDLYAAMAAVA